VTEESVEEAEADADAPCVEVAAPTFDPVALGAPGGFGAYVSSVAQSDAIGGKNCNHGGAVSEAVKAAKAEAKAARDAAKAERRSERDAAKAERSAAKAAKFANGHGKGKHAPDCACAGCRPPRWPARTAARNTAASV
jgi:hypothetical protein